MLYLIGMGFDEGDLTIRAIEMARSCDLVYAELYTSLWGSGKNSLDVIEQVLEKPIIILKRADMEENQKKILEEAADKIVGILVPGDPLVATTHIDLMIEAKKAGIGVNVVHGPSIFSAITETGLQIYKFGKTTTIPFRREGFEPTSSYDTIKENLDRGLHTLCLLDIDQDALSPHEAMKSLLDVEKSKKQNVITPERPVVLAHFGDPSKIVFKTAGEVVHERLVSLIGNTCEECENFPVPAVMIFPGRLHSMEEAALKTYAKEAVHEHH